MLDLLFWCFLMIHDLQHFCVPHLFFGLDERNRQKNTSNKNMVQVLPSDPLKAFVRDLFRGEKWPPFWVIEGSLGRTWVLNTLPETNSSPLKIWWLEQDPFLLGISFREYKKWNRPPCKLTPKKRTEGRGSNHYLQSTRFLIQAEKANWLKGCGVYVLLMVQNSGDHQLILVNIPIICIVSFMLSGFSRISEPSVFSWVSHEPTYKNWWTSRVIFWDDRSLWAKLSAGFTILLVLVF